MGFIGSPKHWVDFCPPFGHPRHLKSEEYPPGAAMTLTNDPSTRFTCIRSHRSKKLLTSPPVCDKPRLKTGRKTR